MNNPLVLGKQTAGLYHVISTHGNKSDMSSSCFHSVSMSSDVHIWHHRLGHMSTSEFKYIDCLASFHHSCPSVCHVCPRAKQHRLSFPLSSIKSSAIFELLHVDIWGPYHQHTHQGCRFF